MADPVSVSISLSALAFTVGSFAWQHWRKVDAMTCSLVGGDVGGIPVFNVAFHLSFANLGTRALLLHQISVDVYKRADLRGLMSTTSRVTEGTLPQVIAPGGMHSLAIQAVWTPEFLAAPDILFIGETRPPEPLEKTLYFVLSAVAWNPKGRPLSMRQQIAQITLQANGNGMSFGLARDRTFRLGQPTFRSERMRVS